MIELSIITLLNTMSGDFCKYKSQGYNTVKSTVMALSVAQDKYGGKAVREAVKSSVGLEALAIGAVATKCPGSL